MKASENKADQVGDVVKRKWGTYEIIKKGEGFQVKHLVVAPHCELSLQKHFHRSENWVVAKGVAGVVLEGNEMTLDEQESVFIPKCAVHKLKNLGVIPLEVIEVQLGSYVGEDDIVRYD